VKLCLEKVNSKSLIGGKEKKELDAAIVIER
jgi:hypothetical protein